MSEMRESVDNVVVCIEEKLSRLSTEATGKPIISKVNVQLREVNEKAYDPQIVAIGPIHRGKDYLAEMEQQKLSYLNQLLQRRGESVMKYVVELRKMEERSRKCYSSSIKLPDTEQFVEMLLLDGIFIIELLRKCGFKDLRDENDQIFLSDQIFGPLMNDLLLVENQLPFFILSHLFEMTKSHVGADDLHIHLQCLARVHSFGIPWTEDLVASYIYSDHKVDYHLLGLLYITYFPNKTNDGSEDKNFGDLEEINTASELEEGGIEFKTSKEVNMMNISFKDGVMMLPRLNVTDRTEFKLSNMIAYEQINDNNHPNYVTDYIHLMSRLIRSGKDVELLRRAEIIRNWLENDQAVHIMINKLSKHTVIKGDFCYSDLFKSVNKHFRRRRNKWMAKLKRDYFSSPWAILSLIAAIILLLLTATQTVFTIIGSPS